HNIDTIINSSQKKANLLIEVPTAYEESCEKVEEVLQKVINEAIKEKLILSDSAYLGINQLDSSSVMYLIKIHCDQAERYTVKRAMLKKIKQAYEKAGIKIPYNQIEVHHGKNI
ncbi:MAG: mechanosensitive ion channel family protein, partial [Bacilli bacterium]|nr:mechanosensitive ion channel family protein [Bacilli bacterium]